LYREGLGVSKDLVQSYMWAAIAARRGELFAHAFMGAIELKMSESEIEEARARADAWTPKVY